MHPTLNSMSMLKPASLKEVADELDNEFNVPPVHVVKPTYSMMHNAQSLNDNHGYFRANNNMKYSNRVNNNYDDFDPLLSSMSMNETQSVSMGAKDYNQNGFDYEDDRFSVVSSSVHDYQGSVNYDGTRNYNMAKNFYSVPKKIDTVDAKKRIEDEMRKAPAKYASLAGLEYNARLKEIINSVNATEHKVKEKEKQSEYSHTLIKLKYSCYFPKEVREIFDPIIYFSQTISRNNSKNELFLCRNDRNKGCDIYGVPSNSNLTNTIVGEINMMRFNNPTTRTLGLRICHKIKNKKYYLTCDKYVDSNSIKRYHLIVPPQTEINTPINIYRNAHTDTNDYCQLYTYLTPDPDSIDKFVDPGFRGEKVVPVDHPVYKYIVENAPLWENWKIPAPENKHENKLVCIPGMFYDVVKEKLLEIIKIYYPVTNLATLSFEFEIINSSESEISAIDDSMDTTLSKLNSMPINGMVQILFGFRN